MSFNEDVCKFAGYLAAYGLALGFYFALWLAAGLGAPWSMLAAAALGLALMWTASKLVETLYNKFNAGTRQTDNDASENGNKN